MEFDEAKLVPVGRPQLDLRPAPVLAPNRPRGRSPTSVLFRTSSMTRVTRAATREALPMDYIKFARAKGLSWSRILRVHLLKNIMIPIVTVFGLEFGQVVAFAVVTETIFAWPGMGKLLLDSIITLDRPVVVAYLILIVFFLVMLNLIVDIMGRHP